MAWARTGELRQFTPLLRSVRLTPTFPPLHKQTQIPRAGMILIVQQATGPKYAEVVARLVQAGNQVVIANSTAEAFDLITDLQPTVVLLDEPAIDRAPNLLCCWIQEAMTPKPKVLGVLRVTDPEQRAHCADCMTTLPPGTDPSLVTAMALALLEE